ncbi:hypothetical protein E2562_007311 [Oryza meyeriana var. granulata]|uniref:Uncharacterized protein n=1 Tax=Oryza meyeriana var. granulata TaxID=110450 RepID=A0A6G1CYJ4_9ORYZ|nr:hypothetical protein E2562_007311 [Oryza meyeriana var. granulata]
MTSSSSPSSSSPIRLFFCFKSMHQRRGFPQHATAVAHLGGDGVLARSSLGKRDGTSPAEVEYRGGASAAEARLAVGGGMRGDGS